MLKNIYIETSIPSFYYTSRLDVQSIARKEWTREWWEKYANEFELTSSIAVIDELQQGTSQDTKDRITLLNDVILLEINKDIIDITQIYIDHLVMPNDPKGDALHLALACYHKIDVLLTWNCQHLANANKFDHIRRINFQIGLPTPILTTPLNYLEEKEEKR